MVIFSTFGTVFTFGTPVAFGTLRIGSVCSTLGIILNEFWYICGTFVHSFIHCTCYSSFHSWDITISVLEKQTSAMLEFYFRFRFRPYHCIGDVILHQAVEFHPNQTIFGSIMMLYRFSRWRTLRRNFTSGFGLADVPHFRRSMSVSKPNFVVMAITTGGGPVSFRSAIFLYFLAVHMLQFSTHKT